MNREDFDIANKEDFAQYVVRPQKDIPETELVEGSLSHLVDTDGLTISFLRMEKHSAFEVHSHVQEQIMIVTKGNCDEIIDGKCYHVKKGDVIRLPSGVPHGAFINEEDCYAIDLFIGGRPDYIQKFYQQNSEAVLPYR